MSAQEVFFRDGDRNVGVDTELRMLFVHVQHRASRETDAPAVGKFRAERQPAAASRAVSHNRHMRQQAHGVDEVVGRAIRMAVRQHHDRTQPADVFGRREVNRLRVRKIIVPVAVFVLDVARQHPFLQEAGSDAVGVGQGTSAVVADVNNQPFAILKMKEL